MSNLGDLLDDYEPERLAKLAADDLITKARREAMPQDVRGSCRWGQCNDR